MTTLTERLTAAASNKALSIGEAWNLLQEAKEEIERLSLLNIKLACAQREIERLTKERDEAQMVENYNSVRGGSDDPNKAPD